MIVVNVMLYKLKCQKRGINQYNTCGMNEILDKFYCNLNLFKKVRYK